jgi:hypothetical protein
VHPGASPKNSTLQGASQNKKNYRGENKTRPYYRGINLFTLYYLFKKKYMLIQIIMLVGTKEQKQFVTNYILIKEPLRQHCLLKLQSKFLYQQNSTLE